MRLLCHGDPVLAALHIGLFFIELLGEALRCRVAPGGDQRLPDCRLCRGLKTHIGAAPAAPGAIDRLKDLWFRPYEQRLLLWSELDHALDLARREGGEDLATDPEIRMVHV